MSNGRRVQDWRLMGRDTLELEQDYYLSLAQLYDTYDLNMPSSSSIRIGAIAESDFITQCLVRNFEPHAPVTPMPWDFLVTCPAGTLKIQVKSTNRKTREGSYNISTSTGRTLKKKDLNKDAIDIVACFIQPEHLWFLIPIEEITGRTTRLSADQTTRNKYQKYRENWSIFYE